MHNLTIIVVESKMSETSSISSLVHGLHFLTNALEKILISFLSPTFVDYILC